MKTISVVEKIEKSGVIVSTVRKGACSDNCAQCKSCTAQKIFTNVYCDFDVKVGDVVEIESDTFSVLTALFILFFIPVLLPAFLYLVLSAYNSVASFVGLFFGIVSAVCLVWMISRSDAFLKRVTPKIVSIVE